MQYEELRKDAKQLLRVAFEQRVDGTERMQVDFSATAEHRGLNSDSPHLAALVDFMEVAGWVEPDRSTPDAVGDPIHQVTARGLEVLREV